MKMLSCALVLLSGSLALADAAPPEVAKTVDAFVGKWAFDATFTEGAGGTPAKAKMKMECKKIALGQAADCSYATKLPDGSPLEGEAMVAYDRERKEVHFMAMTSQGEVHDHRCRWKELGGGDALSCEPLSASVAGQPLKEALDFGWTAGGKTMTFKSVSTMKDGKILTFEGTGKRK
jgi:hypothetical protein